MSSHPSITSSSIILEPKDEQEQEQEQEQEWEWSSPMPPTDEERQLPSKEEATENGRDLNLVGWEENDKENPRNWSTAYKSWITFQLGMFGLAASVGTSIISPAEVTIAEHIGVSSEVSVLAVSLYL